MLWWAWLHLAVLVLCGSAVYARFVSVSRSVSRKVSVRIYNLQLCAILSFPLAIEVLYIFMHM